MLEVSRTSLGALDEAPLEGRKTRAPDPDLVAKIHELVIEFPTFGYRRIRAILNRRHGLNVGRKKVQRIFQLKGWQVTQRMVTPRPRVRGMRSRADASNQRWAIDMTHIYCGEDGWGHLVVVIDCYDREVIGWEFALRGRAREAERALEDACIRRFGTLRPEGPTPVVRSDNGLIFLSKRFRAACKAYRLTQEFVTPYTPEQNGLVERFFRSLKEECVWQQLFSSFQEARSEIRRWINFYNEERPHQALGYRAPAEVRPVHQQLKKVA